MPRSANLVLAATLGLAMNGPALAQLAPAAASVQTTGSVRIMQPAMIATSQDLMFAVTAPAVASLTTVAASQSPSVSGAPATSTSRSPRSGTNEAMLQSTVSPLSARVPMPAQATFLVTGDAGQSISVTVPPAVGLTREGGGATALLTTTDSLGDGPQFLGGNFASVGALSFNVGGQVTLANASIASGTYNGVLAVVAQYN